jgi:hypothetical protein
MRIGAQMAGIESYYNNKKKKKKMGQIPINAEGVKMAREAPDDELDEFMRDIVLDNVRRKMQGKGTATEQIKNYGESTQTTSHHQSDEAYPIWAITSQRVITNVYQIDNIEQPRDAIAQVRYWEEHGQEGKHVQRTVVDWLTPQVIGLPREDYETHIADGNAKLVKKGGLSNKEVTQIGDALDIIIEDLDKD